MDTALAAPPSLHGQAPRGPAPTAHLPSRANPSLTGTRRKTAWPPARPRARDPVTPSPARTPIRPVSARQSATDGPSRKTAPRNPSSRLTRAPLPVHVPPSSWPIQLRGKVAHATGAEPPDVPPLSPGRRQSARSRPRPAIDPCTPPCPRSRRSLRIRDRHPRGASARPGSRPPLTQAPPPFPPARAAPWRRASPPSRPAARPARAAVTSRQPVSSAPCAGSSPPPALHPRGTALARRQHQARPAAAPPASAARCSRRTGVRPGGSGRSQTTSGRTPARSASSIVHSRSAGRSGSTKIRRPGSNLGPDAGHVQPIRMPAGADPQHRPPRPPPPATAPASRRSRAAQLHAPAPPASPNRPRSVRPGRSRRCEWRVSLVMSMAESINVRQMFSRPGATPPCISRPGA